MKQYDEEKYQQDLLEFYKETANALWIYIYIYIYIYISLPEVLKT